ncbi:MAG TPA: hypothetical protein VGJ36_09195 [Gemmatimonadales bacterium]
MQTGILRRSPGVLVLLTIAAVLVALLAPGVGGPQALAQVVACTPGSSVAGIQTFGTLSMPIQASLVGGMNLNGLPLSVGQPITIVGLPSGYSLPLSGTALLPAGSTIMVQGQPSPITLTSAVNINLGLTGLPLVAASLPAPMPGVLTNAMSIGGVQLPAGALILITGLPAGMPVPSGGLICLPPGATITVANLPQAGQLTLTAPASVDLSAANFSGGTGLPPGAVSQLLAAPMAGVLTSNVTIGGGLSLPAGAQIMVTGIPQGFVVPQTGIVTFPPGTTITVPTRVDLGQITLSVPVTIDLSVSGFGALPGSGLPGMLTAPMRANLLASFNVGGANFLIGEAVDILSLPTGFTLPAGGPVTLPIGTVIGIPSRADLGPISLQAPLRVDLGLGVAAPMLPVPPAPAVPAAPAPEVPLELPAMVLPSILMLPEPMMAWVEEAFTAGGIDFAAGDAIWIVGVPADAIVTAGDTWLPAGSLIMVPDWPERGAISLDWAALVAVAGSGDMEDTETEW